MEHATLISSSLSFHSAKMDTEISDNLPLRFNESLMPYSDGRDLFEALDFTVLLQQFLSKISANQTSNDLDISFRTESPSTDENLSHLLSRISLWFVLLINPIVILFGVVGNLFAIYLLIHSNVVKLPVSFYTIMLNISDTLNLLIPVLIFWLDNCFNRTPEHGYFRDKSNFLCKILMCPDQLFSALSAWYMCAISFNRWYSVWRPSYYFSRQSFHAPRPMLMKSDKFNQRTQSIGSVILLSLPCYSWIKDRLKYRQHLQAFRSIGLMTLLGILFCLYPIFMHELRIIGSTNEQVSDSIVWKRCYYSRKFEHLYDIIGMILSCLLHVLPLTFVAVMNVMIILRLRQRQSRMSNGTHRYSRLISKERVRFNHGQKKKNNTGIQSSPPSAITHKDQSTSTDPPAHSQINLKNTSKSRRHRSRDRTITIILVSVALSYLILTIPYRLFWSYNVYIKRMYPARLNSSNYLLQMHYIDHILRTIRNIHYGTNFLFLIGLSKAFRRKVQQLFQRRKSSHSTNRKIIKRPQTKEHPFQQSNALKTHEHIKQEILLELKHDDRFRVFQV